MRDFENWGEERRKRWEQRMERHRRTGHIWTGLLIMLVGVAALIKTSVPDIPHWVFGWQMLLIVIGLFLGVKEKFRGGAWFILILIGTAFLITELIPDLDARRYIWPVALIVVGSFFMLRPRRQMGSGNCFEKKNAGNSPDSTPLSEGKPSPEDFVDSTSIFGGAHKIILSKDFKGGDIVNIFGGTELNLSQADIQNRAILEMTTIFGGTKLILPSSWSVKSEATIIFGGIEDKRSMPPTSTANNKILVLKGTVIFGGIEIKNF